MPSTSSMPFQPAPPAPATPASALDPALSLRPGDPMAQALAAGAVLAELLEAEFAALKAQDISALEQMQERKTDLLQALAAWAADAAPAASPGEADPPPGGRVLPPGWPGFQELIGQCRQAHWRNETVIARQLDAIRGTLSALNAQDPLGSPVELYDRMGQLARRKGLRGYSDA